MRGITCSSASHGPIRHRWGQADQVGRRQPDHSQNVRLTSSSRPSASRARGPTHITLANHRHLADAVTVNKKFWEGLPADVQGQLEGAMDDATTYANAIAQNENATAFVESKAGGKSVIDTPTGFEIAAWKKALMPVHKEMESHLGYFGILSIVNMEVGMRQAPGGL